MERWIETPPLLNRNHMKGEKGKVVFKESQCALLRPKENGLQTNKSRCLLYSIGFIFYSEDDITSGTLNIIVLQKEHWE